MYGMAWIFFGWSEIAEGSGEKKKYTKYIFMSIHYLVCCFEIPLNRIYAVAKWIRNPL